MLRPGKLTKVRIVVLNAALKQVIADLHTSGLLHLTKSKYSGLSEGRPLEIFEDLSENLVALRGILSIIGANATSPPPQAVSVSSAHFAMSDAKKYLQSDKIMPLYSKLNSLVERSKELESNIVSLKKALPFGMLDFSKLSTKTVSYAIGDVDEPQKLISALSRIGESNVLTSRNSKTVVVLYSKANASDVESILSDLGFESILLPQNTQVPSDTLAAAESELLSISPQIASIKSELATLSNANHLTVLSLVRSLEVEVERAEVASNFASSKHLQVIEGWVLAQNYSQLASLVSKYSGNAYVEELGMDSHLDSPPVILQNPKIALPFEWITKNFSMPNYFEFDPTMAYFVALPIMYGMLVGDVIYGAMSLGISSWFMKKFKNNDMLANVSKIWFYSAIPSMIFGLIYDEWAGMTHFHLLEFIHSWTGISLIHAPLYLGFPRIENAITLVAITAGLGMLHLTIGFILGALNEWNHNKKHAIAKLAWIGVEIGGLMALLSLMGITTPLVMNAGLGILGLSVAYLGYAEGLVGIIELPGLLGNILSYTRIAAVGIAGVVMAELINKFLLPTPEAGVFGLLLFPIFIAFHIINCFIAMFESIIQGARLNIVEFKSKFLHGGKEIFSPFMLKK